MLGRGSGLNMNQISPMPPYANNIYWSKKWYEFGKKLLKSKIKE